MKKVSSCLELADLPATFLCPDGGEVELEILEETGRLETKSMPDGGLAVRCLCGEWHVFSLTGSQRHMLLIEEQRQRW